MNTNLRQYQWNVRGIHCASCRIRIQDVLSEHSSIYSSSIAPTSTLLTVEVSDEMKREEVYQLVDQLLAPLGYTIVDVEKKDSPLSRWHEYVVGGGIALLMTVGFLWLQKSGIFSGFGMGELNYSTALLLGIVASLSTCLTVVGGVVLSISATYAQGRDALLPQVLFHVGRLVGFLILGGLLGALGSVFSMTPFVQMILQVVVSMVMIVLGLRLLDIQIPVGHLFLFPASWRNFFDVQKGVGGLGLPVLLGAGTFFLPCGFTQTAQLFTLTTGSAIQGALTMFAFALGTFPVLALISFGAFKIAHHPFKNIFFKAAGFLVVFLALFALYGVLIVEGIIDPLF